MCEAVNADYNKYWGDWIDCKDVVKCPCLGQYVQVYYGPGDVEEGIARDHVSWYHATSYRVRLELS